MSAGAFSLGPGAVFIFHVGVDIVLWVCDFPFSTGAEISVVTDCGSDRAFVFYGTGVFGVGSFEPEVSFFDLWPDGLSGCPVSWACGGAGDSSSEAISRLEPWPAGGV